MKNLVGKIMSIKKLKKMQAQNYEETVVSGGQMQSDPNRVQSDDDWMVNQKTIQIGITGRNAKVTAYGNDETKDASVS